MKVVLIYAQGAPGGVNRKLHIDFFDKFGNLCDEFHRFLVNRGDIDVKTPKDIRRINDEYKPDVAILYHGRVGKNRVKNGYFSKFKCLKVMIEVDYYEVENKRFTDYKGRHFYKRNEFDLVIQRGSYVIDSRLGIPSVWLPFSADEKVFFPSNERINKVGMGATVTNSYPNRQRIVNMLKEYDIFEYCGRECKKQSGKYYPNLIRSMDVGLNVVENKKIKTPFGKLFEYMASGTVVLSPKFNYDKILFSNDSYIEYKEDGSNVIEKAREILNDHDRRKEMSKRMHNIFLKNHTDEIRIKEAYDIINDMLEGREPRRKWGI